VEGQVDESTRLVALASCHFLSGWRIDVPAIGEFLRQRDILFCVDGIQTLGAFPTSVEHVDFFAADAHKWLLGPLAAGLFYVRQDVQDRLQPTVFGWHNVRCPNYVAQENIVHPPDARRYEAGSANLLGIAGLEAAMRLLLDLGIERIAAELLRKRNVLIPALKSKGFTVLHESAPPEHASGIVTFLKPGHRYGAASFTADGEQRGRQPAHRSHRPALPSIFAPLLQHRRRTPARRRPALVLSR
jgi:selenocysteine lyase/cysteine desulfurase